MQFFGYFLQILGVMPAVLLRAVAILAIGLVLGTPIALALRAHVPVLAQLLRLYTSFFRGTPILVQLLFWYYLLPQWSSSLLNTVGFHVSKNSVSADVVLIFTFALVYAAYLQETVQASLASIDPNQLELADSLGYTRWQKAIHIIIPQAVVYALPNLFNQFLNILKALSMGFAIAVIDLFAKAKLIAGLNGDYMASYSAAALVYWLVCGVLFLLMNWYLKRRDASLVEARL